MSMIEAYFDESGTHRGSAIIGVAGYIFEKENSIQFDREWRAVLDEYCLPFFRMSACAHGVEPFDKLSMPERIDVEKKMIAITNKWMSHGMAITVHPDMYIRVMPMEKELGDSSYSFCARFCLTGARRCMDEKKLEGDCAYFFESGHRSQSEANAIMDRLYKNPTIRKTHHYSSHTFIEKSKATPLQAADLLAWQWYADIKRRARGEKSRRLDAKALFEGERHNDYSILHCDELMLRELAARSRRRHYFGEGSEMEDPSLHLFYGNEGGMTFDDENAKRKATD
jgi:hypothetical protein